MTNTLHRHGTGESLQRDYIVFAIPSRGYNDRDCVPRLQQFLRLALRHDPVNIGDAAHASSYRPDKSLTPLAHWSRKVQRLPEAVIAGVDSPTTVSAVFDNPAAVEGFIRDLREADLGISVNLSATIEGARECCRNAGQPRHSVEYALRCMGNKELLAESRVLDLATMCGHGMISFNFARKMMDWVRAGRRSPAQASEYLARLCTCGIFNPVRAAAIFEEVRRGQ